MQEIEQNKIHARVINKHDLQDQMKEREHLKDEAYNEYLKEKNVVDEAMQRLINDDRNEMIKGSEKKKTMYNYMVKSLEEKADTRAKLKEEERMLMERIKRYQEEAENREAKLKMKKAEENAAKEQIFARLNEEEMKRRAEKEYIENLRIDLITEEVEEAARLKDIKEAEDRER